MSTDYKFVTILGEYYSIETEDIPGVAVDTESKTIKTNGAPVAIREGILRAFIYESGATGPDINWIAVLAPKITAAWTDAGVL